MGKNQEKIFFQLYENESEVLFRFVSFRIADHEKVKDILQESYLRLWKVLNRETIENERAYLYRIARNLIIDSYRKIEAHSLDKLIEEDGFDVPSVETATPEEIIDAKKVKEFFRELPEQYREIFWLRFVEDWSVKDIAQVFSLSENVVSVRIYRGLKLLRKKLKSETL